MQSFVLIHFFLLLVVGLSGNPFAIGAILAAMVYMSGYISGGHYNPAVTLEVLIQKKIKFNQAGIYMLAQILAGILATVVRQAMHGGKMVISPGVGVSFSVTILVEIVFTFALVSDVLHTAVNKKNKGNDYYWLAISIVVMAAVYAGDHISGCKFNPALGLGPNSYNWSDLSNIWLYILGPFLGAILASLIFAELIDKSDKTKT